MVCKEVPKSQEAAGYIYSRKNKTEVRLTLAICDGLEDSNLILGMFDENCKRVDLFRVTERASRANLLIPERNINAKP